MSQTIKYLVSLLLLMVIPIFWEGSIFGRSITLILMAIGGLIWFLVRGRSNRPFYLPKVILPLSLYLGFQTLLLFIAPLPEFGGDIVISNLLLLVVFVFFVDTLANGWGAKTWENALISQSLLVSLLELLVVFLWYRGWWSISGVLPSSPPVGYRASGILLGHANILSGYINLVWPLTLFRFFTSKRNVHRALWGGILLLFLFIEYLTSSRGGWFGLGVGIVAAVLLVNSSKILRFIRKPKIVKSLRFERRYVVIGVAILIIVIIASPLLSQQVKAVGHDTFSGRLYIWENAWEIFLKSPLWGNGPGAYSFFYPAQSQSAGRAKVFHPHNLPLYILAETGIIGFILLAWAIWLILKSFIAVWRKEIISRGQRYSLAAYAAVGIAFLSQQMIDYLFLRFFYAIGAVLVLALMLQLAPQDFSFSVKKRYMIAVSAILTLTCFLGIQLRLRGVPDFTIGLDAARMRDWETAQEHICLAADSNPQNTFFDFQCGLASAFLAYEEDAPAALDEAITYQAKGLAEDPYWFVHWANLASYEWEKGDLEVALGHMQRATSLAPDVSIMQLNLGWMSEALGLNREAKAAYQTALDLEPGLRDSLFFYRTPLRQAILSAQAVDDPLTNGWQALHARDMISAENYFQKAIRSYRFNGISYLSLAYSQQLNGKPAEAWRNVQTGLFVDSTSPRTMSIAAQIALMQGKQAEAKAYLAKALDLIGNKSLSSLYYSAAYGQGGLSTDLSPFLHGGDLTSDMEKGLRVLAEDFLQEGERDEYRQLIKYLERASSY